jgi:hypothetical protein
MDALMFVAFRIHPVNRVKLAVLRKMIRGWRNYSSKFLKFLRALKQKGKHNHKSFHSAGNIPAVGVPLPKGSIASMQPGRAGPAWQAPP